MTHTMMMYEEASSCLRSHNVYPYLSHTHKYIPYCDLTTSISISRSHTYSHTHNYTPSRSAHVCTHTHTHTRTHKRRHTHHTCIHAHTHKHTHTHKRRHAHCTHTNAYFSLFLDPSLPPSLSRFLSLAHMHKHSLSGAHILSHFLLLFALSLHIYAFSLSHTHTFSRARVLFFCLSHIRSTLSLACTHK